MEFLLEESVLMMALLVYPSILHAHWSGEKMFKRGHSPKPLKMGTRFRFALGFNASRCD